MQRSINNKEQLKIRVDLFPPGFLIIAQKIFKTTINKLQKTEI